MLNENMKAPFDALLEMIETRKHGIIVLCSSTRSALLLKRKILERLGSRAILDTEFMSTSELIARLSREIGIESKVIGGLGREMLVSEILTGLKTFMKAFPSLDMRDYVKGISEAIAELIQAGVADSDIGRGAVPGSKMQLLRQAYSQYRGRLASNHAIDAKELPSKIFETESAEKIGHQLEGKQIIEYCLPEDRLLEEVTQNLEKIGVRIDSIHPIDIQLPKRGRLQKLYARQGRQLAREVARKCKYLATESNCRFSDICIVVPQSPGKERELTRALQWAGIPCSDPVWENLSDHPVASSLSSAIELFSRSSEPFDIFFYCNAPYFGLEQFERGPHNGQDHESEIHLKRSIASRVESYLKQKSKPLLFSEWSNISKWNKHFRPFKQDDHEMDGARATFYRWTETMHRYAKMMNRKASWSEHCDSLEKFFSEFYIKKGLLNDEKRNPKGSSIEIKALVGIQQVIDKVRSANQLMSYSSGPVEWAEFASTIQQAFREKRLMLRGSSLSGVGIAEAKDIIGLDHRHIIFYEVTESNFPMPWNTGWVLTEQDRKEIGGMCDKSVEERNALAKYQFMMAANAASETLCFSIPSIGEDEKPVNASIWVEEVEEAFSTKEAVIEEERIKRRLPAPESEDMCITGSEQCLKETDDQINILRRKWGKERLKELNLEDEIRIEELAASKFGDEYKWSPSMLNQYLSCGLSIIPKYLDGLREREEYEELPSAATTGDFLHGVAEKVLIKIAENRTESFDSAWRAIEQLIHDELTYENAEVSSSMSEEMWQLYKGQYTGIMTRFAQSELKHAQQGGSVFTGYITEKDYTTGDGCGKLSLGDIEAAFRARVDRIDVTENAEAAIFDYKTGSIPEKKADVQLDFYAIIASQVLGFTPIATAYFPLSSGKGSTRLDVNNGDYVEESSDILGFKKYNKNNKSLVPHPLSETPARLASSAYRISELIKEVKSGEMLKKGPIKLAACKYCVRDAVCWKMDMTELEED